MNLFGLIDIDEQKVSCESPKAIRYLFDPQGNPERVLYFESKLLGWAEDVTPGTMPDEKHLARIARGISTADGAMAGRKRTAKDGRSVLLSCTHWPPGVEKVEVLRTVAKALGILLDKECPGHPRVVVGHGDTDQPHVVAFLSRHDPVSGAMYHPGPKRLSVYQSFNWTDLIKSGRRQDGVEIAQRDGVILQPSAWHEARKVKDLVQLQAKDQMLEKLYKAQKGMGREDFFKFRKTKVGKVISLQYTATEKGKPKKYSWRLSSLVRAPMSFVPDLLRQLGLPEWAEQSQKYLDNKAKKESVPKLESNFEPTI